MELLLVILFVVVLAAVAFAVIRARRQRGAITARRSEHGTPLPGRSRAAGRHPMADAVAEHARATDPRDVVAAENRLQAQAGRVASGLRADAHRTEHARADEQVADAGGYPDPRTAGYADPAFVPPPTDPRLADIGDRDARYDPSAAGDPADPREDRRPR